MTRTLPLFGLGTLLHLFGEAMRSRDAAPVDKSSANDATREDRDVLVAMMEQHPDSFDTEYGMVETICRYRGGY